MILPSKRKLRRLRRKEILTIYKKLKKAVYKNAKKGDRDLCVNFYSGYYTKYYYVEVASRLIAKKDKDIKLSNMNGKIITPLFLKW